MNGGMVSPNLGCGKHTSPRAQVRRIGGHDVLRLVHSAGDHSPCRAVVLLAINEV